MKKTTKNTLIALASAFACAFVAAGCAKQQAEKKDLLPVTVVNGGFESADLSGWTVEYGDAFTDDCVAFEDTFTYAYDADRTKIPVGQTGNWYLCGKGFDGKYSVARTGA
ncbi:MAG: hypothetical protein ACI4SH_08630, partial [Candidatus Scatosoma sp.]